MEEKREEIYERIPWETLENPKNDRQTLIIGIAAAVVVGALVYSFVSNRQSVPPAPAAVEPTAQLAPAAPAPTVESLAPPPALTPPNITEADLYAVAPAALSEVAAAHAEWFVLEYLTVDGSQENPTLRMLLPGDIPIPSAPEGARVFVEWVRALSTEEIDVGIYSVDVLARYMVAPDGQTYERVAPELLSVVVAVSESGAQVTTAPTAGPAITAPSAAASLVEVPSGIVDLVLGDNPNADVVGGIQSSTGAWQVVAMVPTSGGIVRPVLIEVDQ